MIVGRRKNSSAMYVEVQFFKRGGAIRKQVVGIDSVNKYLCGSFLSRLLLYFIDGNQGPFSFKMNNRLSMPNDVESRFPYEVLFSGVCPD